jgi:acyl carrier protein
MASAATLTDFLHTEFYPKPLGLGTSLEVLGLDSLDTIDLVNRLEETLGVAVTNEQMARIRTLEDIYRELGVTPPADFDR